MLRNIGTYSEVYMFRNMSMNRRFMDIFQIYVDAVDMLPIIRGLDYRESATLFALPLTSYSNTNDIAAFAFHAFQEQQQAT